VHADVPPGSRLQAGSDGIIRGIPAGATVLKGCIKIHADTVVAVCGCDIEIAGRGRRWELTAESESIAASWKWELDAMVLLACA